jgi:methionine-rich copper-binding protein CopC
MAAGTYTVAWRTMAKDGHIARGTFAFTVAPAKR